MGTHPHFSYHDLHRFEGPSLKQEHRISQVFNVMRKAAAKDPSCLQGNLVDFQLKCHSARGELAGLGKQIAEVLFECVKAQDALSQICNPRLSEFFSIDGWSFFGTHIPSLTVDPALAYASCYWHHDGCDPEESPDSSPAQPFFIWLPRSSGTCGTEVLIPSDYKVDPFSLEPIPALCDRGLGIQPKMAISRSAPFTPYRLRHGRIYGFYPTCVHRRSPITSKTRTPGEWRYSFRMHIDACLF